MYTKITAVLLSMSMVSLLGMESFAAETLNNTNQSMGMEPIDQVVETLMEDNTIAPKYEKVIEEDIETLDSLGLPVENIDSVDTKKDNIVYELSLDNDVIDKVSVDTESDGTITMNVTEDNKKDELIFSADGSIYLDGQKVIYETEEINSSELSNQAEDDSVLTPSTGGIKWYAASKAPSKLKNASYKSYSVSWKCSNLKLQKALGNITYSTVCGLLKEGPLGGAAGFATAAFWELVTADKSSKNISYIDYVAKAKNNPRYFKGRKYVYSKANYKGKKTTSYSYGIML